MKCFFPYPLKIAGVGRYLPRQTVLSSELESNCVLPPGWCSERLGVLERRWSIRETQSFMGAEAAKEALTAAGMDYSEIDLIINASLSFERRVPEGAALIQRQLGLNESGIPCISIYEGCQSFLTALVVSTSMIAVGRYQNILIVASELISSMLDPKYPEAYALFGDGAAAVVVTKDPEQSSQVHEACLHSYSRGMADLQSLSGFTAFQQNIVQPEDLAIRLNFKAFIDNGITCLQPLITALRVKYSDAELSLIIPQQAGNRFFSYLTQSFQEDKLVRIFDRFGLCGAASYPLALYEAVTSGRLKRGDLFLMLGLGAGPSVGAIIMTY
ncbi:MAG TPA: 3-oxoacyl-[acyl-carrier-protein] synthase III C-terminal domain-containing protein [Bacillota bacterium]